MTSWVRTSWTVPGRRSCYDPKVRVGDNACPFTAGYWLFLNRHRERFARNHRMFQMIRGLDRLSDLDELVEQGPVADR